MENKYSLSDEWTNLVDLLTYRASQHPHKIAYTFLNDGETEEIHLTYGELDRKARDIASLLQNLGLVGRRALLLYPSGLEFIVAFFGCLYAGVVAVPGYPPRPNRSMERLEAIIQDAEAKEVLTTQAIWQSLKSNLEENELLGSMRWLATDNLSSHFTSQWHKPVIGSETLAFLQYTSGSTGKPKGVMVSHGNLLHNQKMIQEAFGHSQKSIGLSWLPLFHDMGLIGNVLQPLYVGFPVTLMSPMHFLQKPIRWLKAISRYKATTSGGPNFAYDLCLRKVTPEQLAELDLSSWEVAYTGAEPIRAETLQQFAANFAECGFRQETFYPCYGMAESTLLIAGNSKKQAPVIKTVQEAALQDNKAIAAERGQEGVRDLVGCGHAWLKQKMLIVNPESLTECPEGEVGEIWVSGGSVTQGYWNQSQLTEQTFHAYLADTGVGPFLRTGDLGFVQDRQLFVTGRLKDVIIIRGRNHYPQDLELTAAQSHPCLRKDCGATFTVKINGEDKLVVVQEVERNYLRHIDVEEVSADIRHALIVEHGLQAHAVVLIKTGSIPKTSSGKIQRYACREQFLANQLEVLDKGIPLSRKNRKKHLVIAI